MSVSIYDVAGMIIFTRPKQQ